MSEETEKKLVLGVLIGSIAALTSLVLYGGLAEWWSYINGLAVETVIVIGAVIWYINAIPGVRAFLIGLGILITASFIMTACGFMNQGFAKVIDSITELAKELNPSVVYVQNTGQYDSVKYGTGPFWLSMGGQFILAAALVLLTFVTRGKAPFNTLMVLINIVAATILLVFGGSVNSTTGAAESIIFFGSLAVVLIWETVAEAAVDWLKELPDRAQRQWLHVLAKAITTPIIIQFTALASVIFIAGMVTLVGVTSMTMSQALTLMGQGSIVATLLEDVVIELTSFGAKSAEAE